MTASGSQVSLHTLPEILSQPGTWLTSQGKLAVEPEFAMVRERLASASEILFVGCGSSFYLAEAAASVWTLLSGQRTRALPASEILLFPELAQLKLNGGHVVVISRSGRTSEALRAAEFLTAKKGIATFGVTCALNSELSKVCDLTIALPAADEQSMVMTRSFTSMLLGITQMAAPQGTAVSLVPSFAKISSALGSQIEVLNQKAEAFVSAHAFADYIYLAQGPLFPVAREAALKVTEMSCSYAQPYHTLEFRHGPKSIVSPETCITFFLGETGMEAESEVLVEMKGLGGIIVAICNRAPDSVRRAADFLFELQADVPELALAAPFLVLPQLLGYHTGIKKGFNPDEPKNLSRVVILD
jgi:glucosamine--fructose-6-phosphate aminotransferase (isomerizing)